MSKLQDRMREAVTAPLRIPGLTGEKEVQLVNDSCLKSLEQMVRASERERCVQIIEELRIRKGLNYHHGTVLNGIIEAIRKAEGG